jgi:cephalosporin hydroxylase
MSFGERAAIEGILASVRPALALEIGTAEGGSLARIANHSAEVHSIDVSHESLKRELPPHVTFHTGASAEVLGALLSSFSERRRTLDFVLVDGDHSFEGVRADLDTLLASPATARSVIVIHDTMNPEVRAGIEAARVDGYEKVVYYELDFVPGYVYREGQCRGTAWGGLGVVLTDTSRSPAYSSSPRQTLYCEPFAALQRLRTDVVVEAGGPAAV